MKIIGIIALVIIGFILLYAIGPIITIIMVAGTIIFLLIAGIQGINENVKKK